MAGTSVWKIESLEASRFDPHDPHLADAVAERAGHGERLGVERPSVDSLARETAWAATPRHSLKPQ